MRAVAAVLVLIGHWRNAFFVDFANVHSFRTIALILYIITGAGHQAVIIFFVLSGYLVGGTTLRSLQGGEWSWKRYLTHRLVRLSVVLIPALLLGLFWDTLGVKMALSPDLYGGWGSDHVTHLPLVIFFQAIFVRESRWTPALAHLLAALAVLAAVVGYSWSVAALTAQKTNTVRGWIEKTFLPEVEKNVPAARLRN